MRADPGKTYTIHFLHVTLLSLNLGFAISFACLTYADAIFPFGTAWFERVAGFVNHWVRLARFVVGANFAFLGEVIGIASVVFLFLVAFGRALGALNRILLDQIGCVAALAATPALWIFSVNNSGRMIFWWNEYPGWLEWALVLETSFAIAALYFTLSRKEANAYSLLVLVAHYAFWMYYMWPALSHPAFLAPKIMYAVSLGAGVSWLAYARQLRNLPLLAEALGR